MQLKDKIFKIMVENNLFGKNYIGATNKISNILKKNNRLVFQEIKNLINEGSIKLIKKTFVNAKNAYVGKYNAINSDKGYVKLDEFDGYVLVNNSIGVLDGDLIKLFVFNDAEQTIMSGVLQEIVESENKNIYGIVRKSSKGIYAFFPDQIQYGPFIIIPQDDVASNANNRRCLLEVKPNYNNNEFYFGKIINVYGYADDPITENVAIAKKYGFSKVFSNKVNDEIAQIPTSVLKEEYYGRLDLREKNFVTIDPVSCKDMDDAVYVEKNSTGYKIYVAIADVAHYVKRGSEIDKEAFKRGTSDYLGDGVYPMLPEELSNGICSLNENEDRLARITIVDIDKNGEIKNYRILKGVINSKHKLSYDIADDIHFNKNDAHNKFKDIKNQIDTMFEVSKILTKLREKRGALLIETDEPTFVLDNTKTNVLAINNNHSELESTKIIESFMILNNEVIGEFFKKNNLETIYRIHKSPLQKDIDELNEILMDFVNNKVGQNSYSYQKAIKKIKGIENEDFLKLKILKSLPKAVYGPENFGHFGLASQNYLHFTSPIRRYADLVVHQILDSYESDKKFIPTYDYLKFVGEYITEREKCAIMSEKESHELMYTIWAENHINEEIQGQIYDFNDKALIVKHDSVLITVPYSSINKSKRYNKPTICKTSIKFKEGFSLNIGDKINVKILSTDRLNRVINVEASIIKEKQTEKNNIKKENQFSL